MKSVETADAGGNPENSLLILMDRADNVAADTMGIIRVGPENGERMPVVTVQPIERAKPHEAMAVLQNSQYLVARKSIFHGQMVKL